MERINWKQKLTSRKFWAAVVGFVTALAMFCGVSESETAQIASIIMAGGTLIAYILGEGMADAGRAVKKEGDSHAPQP